MIQSIIDYFVAEFHSNDFLAAAVVAAPLSILTFAARSLPSQIWTAMKRTASIEVRFNSDMDNYQIIQSFIMENMVRQSFSRTYLYQSDTYWDHQKNENVVRHQGLSAGYGTHYGLYKGRLVFIHRTQEQSDNTAKFKEYLTITFVTRSRDLVKIFSDEITSRIERRDDSDVISMRVNDTDYWRSPSSLPKRDLSTVITSGNIGEEMVARIEQFVKDEPLYRKRGTPYHAGIILSGPPGTGKSSLIHAVASATDRSILYLNLGSLEDDNDLTQLMGTSINWRRSLLVIEDADASNADTSRRKDEKKDKSGVTLSALLNVLDGLLSPDGLVCIATTNHPERLDPALLRTGRFDCHYEIGLLDLDAFERMCAVFDHPVSDAMRSAYMPMTGSDIRKIIMESEEYAKEVRQSLSGGSHVEGA